MSYLISDSEHKINSECFSLSTLHSLFINRSYDTKTGELMDFIEAKKYLLKFFFRFGCCHIFNENGKMEILTDKDVNGAYVRRFDGKLKAWFLTSPEITMYKTVCIPNRQLVLDNNINMMNKNKHEQDLKYNDCSPSDRAGVDIMLKFILDVWCSGDKEQYEYLLNWFANMIQGNKNQTLLYVKSATEGIGKSTLSLFIMDHVIGRGVSIQANSTPLLTGNNLSLHGKVFVVFEELLKSTKNEWEKISSCLKEWVTSSTIQYTEKYVTPFTSNNVNNYIINTNNESIKSADGRRYYICDLSTKYLNNTAYWEMIDDKCMKDSVGKAFYLFMMERDIKTFNSAVFPITQRKKEYVADLIKSPFKFLKFNYILLNKNILCSVKELYQYYVDYCTRVEIKESGKRIFTSLLSEVGIAYKSSNSKQLYAVDCKELKEIATQHRWYAPDDADEMDDNVIWSDYKKDVSVQNIQQQNQAEENKALKLQIMLLQNKYEILENNYMQLEKKTKPVETESESEPEPVKKTKKTKKIKKQESESESEPEPVKKIKKTKKAESTNKKSNLQLFLEM